MYRVSLKKGTFLVFVSFQFMNGHHLSGYMIQAQNSDSETHVKKVKLDFWN